MFGNLREPLQQFFDVLFADALNIGLEAFVFFSVFDVIVGDAFDNGRNIFGGDSTHSQAVRGCIFGPLSAEYDLEVRHGIAIDFSAVAVKTEIGYVVLTTGVKTPADFDAEVFDGIVELEVLLRQLRSQLRCETARRGNAQFAGVGARACSDIDDGASSGFG